MYLGKYTIHGWYGVSKQGILDILILGKNSYNPRAQRFLLPPSTVPNVEETQEGPYDAWDLNVLAQVKLGEGISIILLTTICVWVD